MFKETKMAKTAIKNNPRATQALDDLERYLNFCRDYGYRFNEADLYNNKSYPFQQFKKLEAGKFPKDMWVEDARRFGRNI